MLMACRNGHLDVVEYLVERCDADIEQPGSGKDDSLLNLKV